MVLKHNCLFIFFFVVNILSFSGSQICDEIIGELNPDACPEGKYYDNTKCLPNCVKKQGLRNNCSKTKICAQGLICDATTRTCIVDERSCKKYDFIEDINEKPIPEIWIPNCLNVGTYAPKQCKGGPKDGRCFCFDAYGKRIFGEEWITDATDMTCACSRRRSEFEEAGRTDVTLHCDSNGNYEQLQCDSDICWCADPKTGAVLSSVVPPSLMMFLPCFKNSDIGEQYLRKCESQKYAQAKIKKTLKAHGTDQVSFLYVLCDWDGGYGRFQVQPNSIVSCTNRNGAISGPWSAELTTIESFDCNCARDTLMYENTGRQMTLKCEGNGSYKPVQGANGQYFCVDKDGFRSTDFAENEIDPKDCPKL